MNPVYPGRFRLPPPFERTCSGGIRVLPMNVRSPHVRPPPTDQEAHAGREDAPRARRREQRPAPRSAPQPYRVRPRLGGTRDRRADELREARVVANGIEV